LNSYKARITSGISDVCPECEVAPHSVEHLFNCQSQPTQLTEQHRWENPAVVGRLPQPGQLTIGEELLGYHNNNNSNHLGQYANSPCDMAYFYAEVTDPFLPVAITIAGTHFHLLTDG